MDTKQKLINEINTKHEAEYITEQMNSYFDDFISENESEEYAKLSETEKNEIRDAWFSDLKDRL